MNVIGILSAGIKQTLGSFINGSIIYNGERISGNISSREIRYQRDDGGYNNANQLEMRCDYKDFIINSYLYYNNTKYRITSITRYDSHYKIFAIESKENNSYE